jgi:hypothetical protein
VTTSAWPLDRQVDILRQVIAQVQERLPRDWVAEPGLDSAPVGPGRRVDGLIRLVSPQGDGATLVVAVKKNVVTRDLQTLVAGLRSYASVAGENPSSRC